MHQEEQYAIRCLRAGASGYVQKDSTTDELIEAIRRVGAMRRYFSAAVIDQLTADAARDPQRTHFVESAKMQASSPIADIARAIQPVGRAGVAHLRPRRADRRSDSLSSRREASDAAWL
jgi:DNA-binding NarL/FixJ family response regulator